MVTFKQAVRNFYDRYADFSGRTSVSGYWWVMLYTAGVSWILEAFSMWAETGGFWYWVWIILLGIFGLVNIIPSLAIAWRRLHDSGRGGGWIFINLIPIVGTIWYLVLTLLPGEPGPNRFGAPVAGQNNF